MQTDACLAKDGQCEMRRIACAWCIVRASGYVCVLKPLRPKVHHHSNAIERKITWTIYVLWGFIFGQSIGRTERRRVLRVEIHLSVLIVCRAC